MMSDTFEKANQLWFREGRTREALAAYKEALRETPDDPVLAFQLARVLWSMDLFDEARSMLDYAAMHRENLNASGQSVLEMWAAKLQQQPPERPFPQWTPALLDRDALEAGEPADWDWRTIADAAAARRMFGLAAHAVEQWGGVPFDAEEAKEIDDIETNRAIEQNMLAQMYAHAAQTELSAVTPGELDTESAKSSQVYESSDVMPSTQTAQPPVSPQRPVEVSYPDLPNIPLALTVNVTPIEGPVGVETMLEAWLTNPTYTTQIVNRRMLLNHLNAPGEIWLDVDGPEGYRNASGFQVRAGTASNEFFISLAAGGSVEQSWNLNDYESLHVPGEYYLTLIYHNEASRTPDGRPMTVGKVVGSIRFHRH